MSQNDTYQPEDRDTSGKVPEGDVVERLNDIFDMSVLDMKKRPQQDAFSGDDIGGNITEADYQIVSALASIAAGFSGREIADHHAEVILSSLHELSLAGRILFVISVLDTAPDILDRLSGAENIPASLRQSLMAPMASLARASLIADIFSEGRIARVGRVIASLQGDNGVTSGA